MSISDRLDQIEKHEVAWPWLDRAAGDKKILVNALRAVLGLHKPIEIGPSAVECSECVDPKDSHWGAIWPCPTVRAVTAALGEDM